MEEWLAVKLTSHALYYKIPYSMFYNDFQLLTTFTQLNARLNKIEGTPILKLATVKRQKFVKNSRKKIR